MAAADTPETSRRVQAWRDAVANSGARVRSQLEAAGLAAETFAAAVSDFGHAAAHALPDDQVEARRAVCRKCGATTEGTWQHAAGGRRLRTPNEHHAPPGLTICPGSFEAALLTTHGKELP